MIDIVEILCNAFWETGVEDSEENYVVFIKKFEIDNHITIIGALDRGNWKTSGYNFEDSKDEVFFKLKYL